jgi:hypothetical protein
LRQKGVTGTVRVGYILLDVALLQTKLFTNFGLLEFCAPFANAGHSLHGRDDGTRKQVVGGIRGGQIAGVGRVFAQVLLGVVHHVVGRVTASGGLNGVVDQRVPGVMGLDLGLNIDVLLKGSGQSFVIIRTKPQIPSVR